MKRLQQAGTGSWKRQAEPLTQKEEFLYNYGEKESLEIPLQWNVLCSLKRWWTPASSLQGQSDTNSGEAGRKKAPDLRRGLLYEQTTRTYLKVEKYRKSKLSITQILQILPGAQYDCSDCTIACALKIVPSICSHWRNQNQSAGSQSSQ